MSRDTKDDEEGKSPTPSSSSIKASNIACFDTKYRYLFFNEVHKNTFQQAWGVDVELGVSLLDCIPEQDERLFVQRNLDRAISGEIHIDIKECGDIKRHTWESVYSPMYGTEGKVSGVSVTSMNITERKQAEEALQEREKKHQYLFDNMTEGFALCEIICDEKGIPCDYRILEVNKAYEEQTGIDASAIVGKTVLEFYPDIEKSWIEIYGKIALTHKPRRFVNYNHNTDKCYETSAFPCEKAQFALLFKDITKRKQTEEALRKAHDELEMRVQERISELATTNEFLKTEIANHEVTAHALIESNQKFHTIFESSNDAIMLLDDNGFIDCNGATLRMFACTNRDELLGKHPAELSPPRQPDGTGSLQLANERIASAFRSGRNFFEWIHRRVDGEDFPAEVLLTPMTIEGHRVLQATVRDITERKQAEEKTLQLLQQNRDLTQRLFHVQEEERRHLARELHDEFGQWLTAVQLHAKGISELAEGKDSKIYNSAKTICESTTQMHKVTRNIIRELRPPALDVLGLADGLRELVTLWQLHHPETEYELLISADLTAMDGTVQIMLYRIIQESLTNVAKYSQAKHVAIVLHSEQSGTIVLTINDDGKGMDLSMPSDGVGVVGMRERTLIAGGEFCLKSEPDKGVCIEVRLPTNLGES